MKKLLFRPPDISRVETLTAELMAANCELMASEQARMEMFNNISHDLRAPLTAVRGALDRLLSCRDMDEGERCLMIDLMDRRVRVLEHLVGELYYSVTLEQPNFTLNLTPMPVAPFLEEYFVTRQIDNRFDARTLSLELDPHCGAVADIDPDRMVRVLDNLLENALRFSAEGDNITLSCKTSPGEIEISVRDTGCGIRESDLPRIFERTYTCQGPRSPADSHGSGLGLHIAKTIVEKHGGAIRGESEWETGSVFLITLPHLRDRNNDFNEKRG